MLNFDTNYRQASMLYLESPAGSGSAAGYSTCINGAKPVPCQWNDTSQAEAYAHTLTAFYKVCTYESQQARVRRGRLRQAHYPTDSVHALPSCCAGVRILSIASRRIRTACKRHPRAMLKYPLCYADVRIAPHDLTHYTHQRHSQSLEATRST